MHIYLQNGEGFLHRCRDIRRGVFWNSSNKVYHSKFIAMNTKSTETKVLQEKDSQIRQTETSEIEMTSLQALDHLQSQNETRGKNLHQQSSLLHEYHQGMKRLMRIFEAQQNELRGYQDVLPTSFVTVEMEIAKCISGCLADVPEQKRSISQVQGLLRDYGVLVPVLGQNPTISLDKFHLILQDNFQGSYLCQLIDLMLCDKLNTLSKVITFY
jgi:hypothetical protein